MDNSKNLENESFSLSESFKNLSLENKESFASLNSTGQTAPPFFSPHKNIWHKAADKSSKNSYIYKNKNFITKDTPIKYREPCIPTGKTPPRKVVSLSKFYKLKKRTSVITRTFIPLT
jgi:hypothetical protein